jgi:hypothetical protein
VVRCLTAEPGTYGLPQMIFAANYAVW